MPVRSLFGVSFSQPIEMLLLLLQLACYINQYYVVVYLLGPLPFWAILILTFANSRALLALYVSNSTHLKTFPKTANSQFCKKCSDWITHRDHHCVFTGRCVEKNNYPYFISYVLYSYILSTVLVASILSNYPLLVNIKDIEFKFGLPLVSGLISGLFFMVFTAGLLASSFRSIVLGIYTVDEIKEVKRPAFSNKELRMMWFSGAGRRRIWTDFKEHWVDMVGSDISFKQIVFVL